MARLRPSLSLRQVRNGTSRILRIGSAALLRAARQLDAEDRAIASTTPGGPPEHWAARVREKAPWLLGRSDAPGPTIVPGALPAFRGPSRRSSAPGGTEASRRVENREDPGARTTVVPRRAPIGASQPPPAQPIRQVGKKGPADRHGRVARWATRIGIRRLSGPRTRSEAGAARAKKQTRTAKDEIRRGLEIPGRRRLGAPTGDPPQSGQTRPAWGFGPRELAPPRRGHEQPRPTDRMREAGHQAARTATLWPAIPPDSAARGSDRVDRMHGDGPWDRGRTVEEHASFRAPAIARGAIAGAPHPGPDEPYPWPDLPLEPPDDVDAEATLREWERQRRLELEQRSL